MFVRVFVYKCVKECVYEKEKDTDAILAITLKYLYKSMYFNHPQYWQRHGSLIYVLNGCTLKGLRVSGQGVMQQVDNKFIACRDRLELR